MLKKKKTIKKYRPQGMVDISSKKVTQRKAIASSQIRLSKKTFSILLKKGSPKGDIFETAKTAAIMGAKSTPLLIPLCHPIPITKVGVKFHIDKKKSTITTEVEVKSSAQTGVEMEALAASAISSLTIYDMMKWADKSMVISDLKLLEKRGGRSGVYKRK